MTRRMDELNALEEAEAENLAGCSILALERDEPVAKLLAALAWVHKRRTDTKLTYREYVKSARTKDNVQYLLEHFDGEEDEDDDNQGAADVDVSGGPHPDAEDRVLDDDGEPTDPFRSEGDPSGEADAPDAVAETEGSVLPLERSNAG